MPIFLTVDKDWHSHTDNEAEFQRESKNDCETDELPLNSIDILTTTTSSYVLTSVVVASALSFLTILWKLIIQKGASCIAVNNKVSRSPIQE